jgi:hypothetical protein
MAKPHAVAAREEREWEEAAAVPVAKDDEDERPAAATGAEG